MISLFVSSVGLLFSERVWLIGMTAVLKGNEKLRMRRSIAIRSTRNLQFYRTDNKVIDKAWKT